MTGTINILLQTTIPRIEDDWHIGRFSLLRDHLASITDENGENLSYISSLSFKNLIIHRNGVRAAWDQRFNQAVYLRRVDGTDLIWTK
jgi:hypothetical protein